jgi:hypothetical protein
MIAQCGVRLEVLTAGSGASSHEYPPKTFIAYVTSGRHEAERSGQPGELLASSALSATEPRRLLSV